MDWLKCYETESAERFSRKRDDEDRQSLFLHGFRLILVCFWKLGNSGGQDGGIKVKNG